MTTALLLHAPLLFRYYGGRGIDRMWTVAVCVMVFVSFMLQEFECRPWILAGTWLILLASIGMTVYNGPMPTPPDSYWRKLLLEQSNVYFSGIFVILAAKTKLTWDITLT